MKKLLLAVLVAILAIASVTMAACTNGGNSNATLNHENQNSELENKNQESEFEGEVVGELFELEEAYEKGYITVEELEQIAYYVNSFTEYPQHLRKNVDSAIRELAAERMRTLERSSVLEVEAEDVIISAFYGVYGVYSNCFVVDVSYSPRRGEAVDGGWSHGKIYFKYEIGGVLFYIDAWASIVVFVAQS